MEVNSGEISDFVENLIVNSVRSFNIEHKMFLSGNTNTKHR